MSIGPADRSGSWGGSRIDRARSHRRACVLLVLLPVLVSVAGVSGAAAPADILTSQGPLVVSGVGHATLDPGYLHAPGAEAVASMALSAEAVFVSVEREEGVRSGLSSNPTWTGTSYSEDHAVLEDVEVVFEPETETAEVLVYPDGDAPGVRLAAISHGEARYEDNRTLAYTGLSGESTAIGEVENANFSEQIQDPTVWFEATGQATVTGDFSVFVNNLTLEATGPGGDRWSDWSGYREEEPGAPVSAYARRVITLRVVNGTLTTGPGVPLVGFGPETQVQLDGVATAEKATGDLVLGDRTLMYESETLRLQGTFGLSLAAGPGGETADDAGATREAPARALQIAPSGQFQALLPGEDGQGTVAVPAEDAGPGVLMWLGGLVVLGAVATSAVTVGRKAVGGVRAWRFERAMDAGNQAMNERDWEAAASGFELATRLDPEDSVAWYFRGISLVEGGRYEECLGILDEAFQAPGMDPWDILQLEVTAAAGAGRRKQAARALERMIQQDIEIARIFIREQGLEVGEIAPGLERELREDEERGGLDGYV